MCVLCAGPTSRGITSGAAVCITRIFQETSSLICQMPRLMSCFARRSHISGNISFRHPIWCWRLLLCSVAKKAVFGCMLSIRNRRECPSSSSNLSFCTLAEMQKRFFFFFCFVTDADTFYLPSLVNAQECLADIGAETVWQLGDKNVTQKKRETHTQTHTSCAFISTETNSFSCWTVEQNQSHHEWYKIRTIDAQMQPMEFEKMIMK